MIDVNVLNNTLWHMSACDIFTSESRTFFIGRNVNEFQMMIICKRMKRTWCADVICLKILAVLFERSVSDFSVG